MTRRSRSVFIFLGAVVACVVGVMYFGSVNTPPWIDHFATEFPRKAQLLSGREVSARLALLPKSTGDNIIVVDTMTLNANGLYLLATIDLVDSHYVFSSSFEILEPEEFIGNKIDVRLVNLNVASKVTKVTYLADLGSFPHAPELRFGGVDRQGELGECRNGRII